MKNILVYNSAVINENFAVIFDMDGVIVDSNPFHRKALLQFCQKYGFNLTDTEIKTNIFGRTNKEWLSRLFGNISWEKLKNLEEEKEALFREMYLPYIKPVTGLIEFLEMLKKNRITMAIATSAPQSNVEFTLEQTGISEYFRAIITGNSVTRSKPHPEIYLMAAQEIGYLTKDCIVIEDSLSGIEAAKRAGCKVVGITTTHSINEFEQVDLIIENFKELELQTFQEIL